MTFKRVVFFLLVLSFLATASFLAIRFARGERINFKTKTITPTGLLVASSTPDGAPVLIDGKLKTATNDTLNLVPGEYEVEIKKDGFHSWKKLLKIEKELVAKTDAYLFSSFPSLTSLTYTGAARPVLSPDFGKVAFAVATASASKPGLWVLELSERPLGLSREPRQIIKSTPRGRDFAQSQYRWSPDSKQLLVTFKYESGKSKEPVTQENFLLESDRLNDPAGLIDVTPSLELIQSQWEKEEEVRKNAQLSKLPNKLLEALENSVENILFAPNEKMILYTATASAAIPKKIRPPLPASNNQPESRQIKPNQAYVYDLIEDKNFLVQPEASKLTTLTWLATSRHIFQVGGNKVTIAEYDGTNTVDVYTGPFEDGFAFPFPTEDKILILASLGEDQPPNLYAVSLR